MANFNPQMGYPNTTAVQPQPPQLYPYGNFSNLLTNSPYENYLGKSNNQNQFLKCRPVSSKEEAMAFQIDLDGSLWVFTDVGNDKIYTKQINNDGTASFRTYVFDKNDNPYKTSEYVTKEEFNRTIQALIAATQSNVQLNQAPATKPEF